MANARKRALETVRDLVMEADRRQAQKMEALGRLATGVAHDFNNLLTVITGYSQLLLKRLGAEHPGRDELVQIGRASERAASFTRQLLTFGSKRESPPEVLDLNALVAEHARLLRPLVGEAIEVQTELEADLPAVRVGAGQVLQILLNLAANARDAMPQGGRLILATARGPQVAGRWSDDIPLPPGDAGDRSEESPSLPATCAPRAACGWVLLRVSDTGCGMDEPVRARIFEPYFTTKPAGRGLGLGLATVAELAGQLGGEVRVDSLPGRGSTFTLALPAVAHPPAPALQADRPPLAGHETVLVVEDGEEVRALLERVLAMHGFRVLAAANGPAALALARQAPVDLLVTDVVMPHMSGQELAQRLRGTRPQLRVLYVSGYAPDLLDPVAAAAEGEFLQKPFTPEQLLRKVREVLST